ncbi:carboxypeptidase-like regulatory domain-containing protein [Nocardioides sp. WS12]|uniref:carboxypeptidase regulatory-like domain-containing protein n=1 Tax=Nocardioides sp. WS12 TaxID=2486272 RepID=UPI0015FDE4D8|nr:carboxypeptidase-like regulatory domain-containing protein [Nocardioides sp. WS12]
MRMLGAALVATLALLMSSLAQPATAVTGALVTGVVRDAAGQPLEGVNVSYTGLIGGSPTAADGSYSVQVPTGTYTVAISALVPDGPGRYFVMGAARVVVNGDRVANFTLPALVPLNLNLQKSDGSPAATSQIQVPQAIAFVNQPDGTAVMWRGLPHRFVSDPPLVTDSAGRITVSTLQGSVTTIQAAIPHTFPVKMPVAITSNPTNATVKLPVMDRLHGRLSDTAGRGMAGAGISIDDNNNSFVHADTASDGSYWFDLPTGSYSFEASSGNFPTVRFDDTNISGSVAVSGDTEFNVTTPVPAELRVRLKHADGSPATGDSVTSTESTTTLTSSAGTPMTYSSRYRYTSYPDEDDLVVTQALLGTTTTVSVLVPGLGTITGVTDVATDPTEMTMTMAAASATVSGVVRTDDGQPVSGASVSVRSVDTNTFKTTQTDADGSWSANVVPGEVRLTVRHDGTAGPDAAPYTVDAQGSFDVATTATRDVNLPTPVVFTPRVLDASDRAVPGIRLMYGVSELNRTMGGVEYRIVGSDIDGSTSDAAGNLPMLALPGSRVWGQLKQPDGYTFPFDTEVPSADTPTVIPMSWVGSVPSYGTNAGRVTIAGPPDATLSELASHPATSTPDGQTALVGDVAYELSDITPGSTADVTLTLPEGSQPTSVFKVAADGTTTDATSHATISGNTIVLHLTDGGFGDADGTVNGVIVDPVIPTAVTVTPPPPVPTMQITTSTLPLGGVGKPYATRLAATPTVTGPVAWSLVSGKLPPGIALQTRGTLTGTPILATTSSFALRAIDSAGKVATRRFTLTVNLGPIQTVRMPSGRVGRRYAQPIKIWGVAPQSWRLVSGRLPRGLAISTRGTIYGRPRAAGTYYFVLKLRTSTSWVGTATKVRVRLVIRPRA